MGTMTTQKVTAVTDRQVFRVISTRKQMTKCWCHVQQNRKLPRANRWDSEILWLFAVSSCLVSFNKKRKKKHFLFMTIITTAWLMHYKTKIKDEKRYLATLSFTNSFSLSKYNQLFFRLFTHHGLMCMVPRFSEIINYWRNQNGGWLMKVATATTIID